MYYIYLFILQFFIYKNYKKKKKKIAFKRERNDFTKFDEKFDG